MGEDIAKRAGQSEGYAEAYKLLRFDTRPS
jgi:hypothetical protein